MNNQPKFCFVNDKEAKKNTVKDFSKFFFNICDESSVLQLAEKIAGHATVLTAVVDGENAGMTGYYCNDTQSKKAYITVVVIKPDFRGMGIGTAMIKRVISDCADRGFKTVRLEVNRDNQRAIHMYTKLGFRKVEETSNNSFYYELTL